MKSFTLYLMALLISAAAFAEPGPTPSPAGSASTEKKSVVKTKSVINAGAVRFQFNNLFIANDQQDSVLVIFDRYDHTGAGVVYQMFAPDAEQGVTISDVPAGKYFVTIECRGLHRDRKEMLVTVKSQKNEKVRIKLEDSEAFSRDNVKIPVYHPAFAQMAILKTTK